MNIIYLFINNILMDIKILRKRKHINKYISTLKAYGIMEETND